ncbi:MAG: hypothetical protein WAW80_04075 [Candidatus Saccharimonadales bacterium]
MIPFENEHRHDSPLSPEVVLGFSLACSNIARYGTDARTNRPAFKKLSIVDGELQIMWPPSLREGATHIDSGPIASPYKDIDGDLAQARVWTPLEGVVPTTSELLGDDIQMTTVCRDKFQDYTSVLYLHRDTILTTYGRMFEIVRKINILDSSRPPRVVKAKELAQDSDVNEIIDTLIIHEAALQTAHPEIAKRHPER